MLCVSIVPPIGFFLSPVPDDVPVGIGGSSFRGWFGTIGGPRFRSRARSAICGPTNQRAPQSVGDRKLSGDRTPPRAGRRDCVGRLTPPDLPGGSDHDRLQLAESSHGDRRRKPRHHAGTRNASSPRFVRFHLPRFPRRSRSRSGEGEALGPIPSFRTIENDRDGSVSGDGGISVPAFRDLLPLRQVQ